MRTILRLVSSALIWVAGAQAQTTLTSSPNPSILGQPVTLTASTPGTTGKVTFYDGFTLLGISTAASGQAALTTSLLPSGTHSLRALFGTSLSAILTQTVTPVAISGFQPPAGYPTGAGPDSVVVGDFNHDGKADVAAANSTDSTVSVLLGNGDGTFQAAVTYPLDRAPRALAIGDFDGNGVQDLVVAGFGGVSVLLGNANGTFQAAVDYGGGVDTAGVVVGDFNLDGKADVAVVTGNDNLVYVLLGNGDGTFASAAPYSLGGKGTSIAVGDTNADGRPDLLVTVADVLNQVAVLRGNGDGTFQPALYYNAGNAPHSLVLGDFNGDGLLDLAVVNGNAFISVLLGTAGGGFLAPAEVAASNPAALAVGDFNADGKPDLAWVSATLNTVSVALGNGDGTFQTPSPFPAGTNPIAIAATELNGDGKPDLAVVNSGNGVNQVGVLLGTSGLSLAVTAGGAFVRDSSASFTITVINGTVNPIPGPATITVTLPGSLPLSSISGGAWQCAGTTCSRTDTLGAGASYPAVTVTIAVPPSAPGLATVQTSLNAGTSLPVNVSTVFSIPPLAPSLIAPVNGAMDVLEIPSMSWTAADGAASYDFYFGASTPPPMQSNTTLTSASAILSDCTTYYWQVSSRNPGGVAASPIWSFTTRPFLVLNAAGTGYGPIGGTGSVQVADTPGCTWAAVSNSSWLTVTSAASGTNSGTVTYAVAPNISAQRTGTLTIGGRALTIVQSAGCPVSFNPSLFADSTSQTASVAASAGSSCTWSTSSNADWLVIGSASPLTGNGTVSINVSANLTNAVRTGTVTIGSSILTVTQRATASTFADVSPDQQFFDAINLMRTMNITSGCSSNPLSYCPNDPITRAQMAVFIVRSAVGGDNFTYTGSPYFTDVLPDNSFFKWIQKMRDLGITSGCTATTFCPNDTVTRGEMAVFLIRDRYGSTTAFTYPATPSFTDVTADYQFFSWIQKMKQVGITSGCTATQYCPNDTVTRAQMAPFIMRAAFNLFLPANSPVIFSIAASTLSPGGSGTVTITGQNTNFAQGVTQVEAGAGITVSSVTVTGGTTLTAMFTVDPAAVLGPRSIIVVTGSEEAVLPNGFQVQ
ncbi:exported hypothetical protein [Candidatus Sulfopaludibacter sp. SbA4]|nr:exported hypothetical protein [Candidatus Sulfopaludibacter sp. SbA4]